MSPDQIAEGTHTYNINYADDPERGLSLDNSTRSSGLYIHMFPLIALMIFGASHAIPCTSVGRILRGGCSTYTDDSPKDRQPLIGILDLRPTPDPDSIVVLHEVSEVVKESFVSSDALEVVRIARFPLPKNHGGNSASGDEMEQQAASSYCIGSLCSTVYLTIEYDFEGGKTVLHRSFGGVKLMAFVNGARSRWYKLSQINDSEENAATKLILLLVPSKSNKPGLKKSTIDIEATGIADWDASGVEFLIGRMSEAFAFGGQEFQNVKPFTVQFRIFDVGQEKQEVDLSEVIARRNRRARTSPLSLVCYLSDISDAYENAGGVGIIDYQTPRYNSL